MNFKEKIGKELLFFDGAMGTMLQQRGLKTGEVPEAWNILHPDVVKNIHREYLDAGANLIITNTFGANEFKCQTLPYSVEELINAGVDVAKQAVKESGKDALVALDVCSLGKLMQPIGELSFDSAYNVFKRSVIAGKNAGADLVIIETMNDIYETKAAVLAVKENTNLPIVVTLTFDESGKLLTGTDIPAAVATLEGLGVEVLGMNCGLGPKTMLELLPQLTECCSIPIAINPNAGLPVVENGETVFKVTPEEFAADVKKLIEGGIHIAGGCCGTTPAHIKALVDLCSGMQVKQPTDKNLTVVSSYTHAVYFGNKPLIIGERINPTGKSRFKQALRENDFEYIFKEGIAESETGAHILDVNVGLPEINETEVMEKAVSGLQGILDLPLQIDTTNIQTLERAMRIYNGKPMINSVNGKRESIDAIFPLVKKYGGIVVCLTLDENGIPATAQERVDIAKKIIAVAEEYGISKKNLVIDTLVMAVSTGSDNGKITLEALKRVHDELNVNTVLGVSNISFGLPQREKITAAFFTMALQNGLSSGIVNPLSEALMSAYYSFCALYGKDPQCLNYIEKYAQTDINAKPVATQNTEMSLYDAIIKGMGESASKATEKLLQSKQSLEIIDGDLIPALDVVGKGFEEKKLYLPQLLMSAEAAGAAFETIKQHILKSGGASEKKSKIVIATVKGDIHDIGKNIVKVLLENYGFDVIDLGKDVAPEVVVNTVLEQNVKLVGLSALMTTTVVNMEETIKQLRAAVPDCLVMVGGAVLTQEYADMIGADFYSKDAMGSVRYANNLYEEGRI